MRGTRTRRRFSAASPRTRTAALTRTPPAPRARGRVRPRAAQRRVGRSGGSLRLERAEVRAPERPADARGDSAVQAVPREGFRPGHHQRAVRGFRRVQRRRERVRRAGRARGRRAGGGLGSEFGGDSEAGYSETVRSELSAAVFADAPPVLLTAAQLRTRTRRRPAQTARPAARIPTPRPRARICEGGVSVTSRAFTTSFIIAMRVSCARDTRCLFSSLLHIQVKSYIQKPRVAGARFYRTLRASFCSPPRLARHRVSDGSDGGSNDSRRRTRAKCNVLSMAFISEYTDLVVGRSG